MACPHVAGMAAIFLTGMDADRIKAAVMAFEVKDIISSKWNDGKGISRTGRARLKP